jgi:PAS domain S-box-containing protein
MFGYARLELIGRNVKSIVPSPWREKHDLFLDRYRTSGEAKVIGQPPRALFGLHKQGYAFAMNLTIQERRKENGDKSFIAMIVQTDQDKKEGVVIIREDGTIILITKAVVDMFGYAPLEVLRTNVTIFMNDAYAANHESYLRRYKETGEARIIGTPGRNVPARRKDGSIFPASLTVEEEFVGYEKFFLANIQDTTHLKATIYMDGFGTIQNVDNGIPLLLGYRKDDVIGRNIKNIMPPPYNQYHDMYLERFRRTKISNILRSTEGRVLPAVHADGSIVQIRAIITRVDNNEGANANMLFKGVIQRMDSVGRATIRQGFNDNDYIEISKDGFIKDISRSLLNQLGYNQEHSLDEFIGQSIEIIIPPLPSRPNLAKEYWIPKCLSAPDYNFYTLCVNKNYALIPFTINCTMKTADTLIVRFKDISGIDAIISIDEVGTVLAFNEDAFLLLGHDQDETIGRNIKFILAKEIADQHDGFLERYKNTRVKRVVGVARTLNTIHRDQSVMPIEIQVKIQQIPSKSKKLTDIIGY